MAKLSAHGRTELVRLAKREHPAKLRHPGDDTLTRDTFFAVMSDGRILTRQTWTAPGYGAPREGQGYVLAPLKTGWRVHATIKAPAEVHRARWIAIQLAKGYVVEGHPTIPIPPPAAKGPDGRATFPHEVTP